MSLRCPNGHQIDGSAKFCSECGAQIPQSQRDALPDSDTQAPRLPFPASTGRTPAPPREPAPAGKARRGRATYLGAAVLATIVGAVGTFSWLASTGSNELAADAATTTVNEAGPETIPRPVGYKDFFRSGMTIETAARGICTQYGEVIERWRDAANSRRTAISGLTDDSYAAAAFVERRGTGWLRARTEVVFLRSITAISSRRLRSLAGAERADVTQLLIDRFERDALYACRLSKAVRDVDAVLVSLDSETAEVLAAAASRPWFPEDYSPAPNDESVAFKWDDNVSGCQDSYGYCWGIRVVTRDGCPSGLYASINILKGDTVIDFSNDSLNGLDAGQVAEMEFQAFPPEGSGTLSGHIKEINCY